jgi:Domain of unknown function (DUF1818)
MSRQLRSGPGWRVGWNPDSETFQALLGADDWAIELGQGEFEDFYRFALQLSETLEQMRFELMEEEAIVCEASSDLMRLEVRGYPNSYEISFTLLTGRRAEGSWSSAATKEVLRAIQMIQMF